MRLVTGIICLIIVVFLFNTFGLRFMRMTQGSMETTMLESELFVIDKFTFFFSKPKRKEIIAFNDPSFNYSSHSIIRLYQEYVGWPIWPWGPVNWTKRVIGIPGDHVKGVIEKGKPVVYLNGKKLHEPYVNKYPLLGVWDTTTVGDTILWRSFDPSKPYNKQRFFIFEEDRIVHKDQLKPEILSLLTRIATVTSDGTLLLYPELPAGFNENKTQQGDNYWTETDVFDVTLSKDQYWVMGDDRRDSYDSRFFGPLDGRYIYGKIMYRLWSNYTDQLFNWKTIRWNRIFQSIQ